MGGGVRRRRRRRVPRRPPLFRSGATRPWRSTRATSTPTIAGRRRGSTRSSARGAPSGSPRRRRLACTGLGARDHGGCGRPVSVAPPGPIEPIGSTPSYSGAEKMARKRGDALLIDRNEERSKQHLWKRMVESYAEIPARPPVASFPGDRAHVGRVPAAVRRQGARHPQRPVGAPRPRAARLRRRDAVRGLASAVARRRRAAAAGGGVGRPEAPLLLWSRAEAVQLARAVPGMESDATLGGRHRLLVDDQLHDRRVRNLPRRREDRDRAPDFCRAACARAAEVKGGANTMVCTPTASGAAAAVQGVPERRLRRRARRRPAHRPRRTP